MNYPKIKKHCESQSAMCKEVIEEFLICYAAEWEKLEPVMQDTLKNATEISVSYINFLKSEFIAHRIFKENGLIK